MDVYEVFQRRTPEDPLVHAGSILAPDLDMARLLARETHMRHGEGAECYVARRGDLHEVVHPESMAGVIDRSYRKQSGYKGVGSRLRTLAERLREEGRGIDKATPRDSSKATHG
ncbi:MAG: hypothetical protein ACLGH3_00210 [Actinomycetota bacterium]